MPTIRLLLCLAVAFAGCASSSATDGSGDDPAPALVAVCDAADADDPSAAEAAFGRAHDGLHTLARELQDLDRRDAAADLLEAKQRVEAAFAADTVPDDLSDRIATLVDATAAALTETGRPRTPCPEGTAP